MRQKHWSAVPAWLRAAVAACLAVAPAASPAQSRDTSITSTFTKQATAVRPGGAVPAFGQVAVGQRIDYVLTALAQGSGVIPASGIVDALSPNQSYVPGSLHLPPGWTATPNPPYAPNPPNQTVYSAPAGANMLSFQLPVGGSAVSVGASGLGDGMYPIPAANGRIYAVYHHKDSGGRIDCWIATTLARCPHAPQPFPLPISAGDNIGTLYNFNGALVQQRYIYYAAFHRPSWVAGLACWDTAAEAECLFQPVAPLPAAPASSYAYANSLIAGALVVPGTSHVLIAVTDRLYCFDKGGGPTSTAPCPGWPAAGVVTGPAPAPAHIAHFMDLVFEIGVSPARVYLSMGTGANNDGVQCVTLSAPAICNGWSSSPLQAVDPTPDPRFEQYGLDLHPIPNTSGGHGSVCLFSVDGRLLRRVSNPSAPACWDAGGVPAAPTLPGLPFCPPNQPPSIPSQGCVAFTSLTLGSGAGLSRVIFAHWSGGPVCVDMASGTGQPCTGFNAAGLGGFGYRDYGFAPDPLAPNRCVLALGDAGRIYRFDGRTGAAGCPVVYQTTGDPMDFFCKRKPTQLAWSQIVIRNRPTQLAGGTLVVRNANTNAVLKTITVGPYGTSDIFSIASIPYAPNPRLTIEFTPTYSSTSTASYVLEVQFTANEAPQICYQAHVDRCGEIFNRATFGPLDTLPPSAGVPGPVVLPSPWTASASVGLGEALPATPCDSCPPHRDSLDLSIHKTAFYPPWTVGTMGEYQIETQVEQGTLDPATAPTPTLVDNLPAGLTFASFTGAPDWNCVATGPQVACTYHGPPVSAGHPLPPVTIAVNVVGPASGGTVVNCAVLAPDANPQNNRSCVDVTVRPCNPPGRDSLDLSIRKVAGHASWTVGGSGVFEIRVRVEHGVLDPATAPTPTFVDVLPPGFTFAGVTAGPAWTCAPSGPQVACTYQGPPLAPGLNLPPVTLFVHVVGPAGPFTNCATLHSDANVGNNRWCAEVAVTTAQS